MALTDEQILRHYLRRLIAEKNLEFSKKSYKFKDYAGSMRANIFGKFARGNCGTFDITESNHNFQIIKEHINKTGKRLSPYNYFDLDTLIAYNAYLGKVLDNIDFIRERSQRHYYIMSDFSTAIDYTTPKYFLANAGKEETGYYDVKCPIRVLRGESGELMPERTLDAQELARKCNVDKCEEKLQRYLEERHPKEKSVDKKEDYDFIYKRRKYKIASQKHYLDENNSPIRYIVADCVEDDAYLMGYFDMEMNEFFGCVYDTEGKFVCPAIDSGVSVFKGMTVLHDSTMMNF